MSEWSEANEIMWNAGGSGGAAPPMHMSEWSEANEIMWSAGGSRLGVRGVPEMDSAPPMQ